MPIRWLLLLPVSLLAALPPLTSESVFDWRTARAPQISPDGRRVVYALETADRFADAFYVNLWMVSVDGKDQRPLTSGKWKDSLARWSPDGSKLAYVSTRAGRPQIFVRWMDTGAEAKITDLENAPSSMNWSADGAYIAYLARVPGKEPWTVSMPKAPAGATWAPPPVVETRLKWRADGIGGIGQRPTGFTHLFVIPVTGGAARQITEGDFDHGGEPCWMPDGRSVLLAASRQPDADTTLYGVHIWRFGLDGSAPEQLTRTEGMQGNPVASPDGRYIAFTGFADKGFSFHNTNLYLMNADGSGTRQVGSNLDRSLVFPQWEAGSRSLLAMAETEGRSHLYRVPLDGPAVALTKADGRFGTAYAATDPFTLAPGGQIAVSFSSPAEPADIVTFAVGSPDRVRKLTNMNGGLLSGRALGKVEEIKWDSFDGKQMQGWLIYPPGFDGSKKYPLILDIHGGPHAMYGVEFNQQMQIFAGRGFVVFYSNPRGSTGYGEEFGNVIHGRYPGDDFKDLMTGVDAVVAKGFIDPKKLCVTGGSGGGLLTAWTVTQTGRFAAAVSQYPVTNWLTQTGSSDIGLSMMRWMKAAPWENPQQYIAHSPVFFADKVTTPTMVLTGEEDWRTPIGQSEEFYFALKVKKVDTVLVRVPKEPHGIRGAYPSHRIAKIEHILGWMEKYTK